MQAIRKCFPNCVTYFFLCFLFFSLIQSELVKITQRIEVYSWISMWGSSIARFFFSYSLFPLNSSSKLQSKCQALFVHMYAYASSTTAAPPAHLPMKKKLHWESKLFRASCLKSWFRSVFLNENRNIEPDPILSADKTHPKAPKTWFFMRS